MVKNVPEIDVISPRVLVGHRAKRHIGSSLDFGLVITDFLLSDGVKKYTY